MASTYSYQRHLPAGHVRLLTLVSDGENFHGSLEEFRIDDLPYFNALSWCWSSRGERQAISFECDKQPFPVSQHLYNLLSNLNPKNAQSSVRIWIDSICINQDDPEEKGGHVAHMHKIYGRARNVIVWLGMPEGGSNLVMDSPKISELYAKLQRLPSSSSVLSGTPPDLPPAEDPIWKAIGRICDRDWFYRTWVIQEIALARHAELLCGTQRLGWDEFVNLVYSISRVGLTSICRGPRSTGTTRPDGFGVLMDLSWTRTMVQNNELSMSYLLHVVRLREVSKPVDKVYGLLGIVAEAVRSAIKVNYAKNDQQYWNAYVELAAQIITNDDLGFWLLCMASSRERPEQLPTWCPNFNSLTPDYLDFGNQKWRAGLGGKPTKEGGIRLVKDSSSIQIPGFWIDVVDEVVHIGGPYATAAGQEDQGRDGNTAIFLERVRHCFELTLRCIDDTNNAQASLARTLIVNSWIDGSAIELSQSERVRNAYEGSMAYLTYSTTGTAAVSQASANDERQQLAQQYITQLGWWQERPFYTTKNGRIGRGSFSMRAGDMIVVLSQARPVFVLRSGQEGDVWKLVGDAYLHGCMDLDSMPKAGRGPDTNFIIS